MDKVQYTIYLLNVSVKYAFPETARTKVEIFLKLMKSQVPWLIPGHAVLPVRPYFYAKLSPFHLVPFWVSPVGAGVLATDSFGLSFLFRVLAVVTPTQQPGSLALKSQRKPALWLTCAFPIQLTNTLWMCYLWYSALKSLIRQTEVNTH